MKKIIFTSLVIFGVLTSCSKEEDGPTTAEGTWTYTTPDGKIGVDFELKKSGTTWQVINQTLRLEGTTYNSAIQASGINPPAIGSIRINANDATAVYVYFITFQDGTVSGDFTQINVPDLSYTWPHNKTNTLSNIVISRK